MGGGLSAALIDPNQESAGSHIGAGAESQQLLYMANALVPQRAVSLIYHIWLLEQLLTSITGAVEHQSRAATSFSTR